MRNKILGVGLNRTGTTTLGVCLRHFGNRHVSCQSRMLRYWRQGQYAHLRDYMKNRDSFEDWPWPMLYRQVDGWFKNTKFILTTRISPEAWWHSLCSHAARTGPSKFRLAMYGHLMPTEQNKRSHILVYEGHNALVREYFSQRPKDFLEVCWERGDGWDELCPFLGKDHPGTPFPHWNQSNVA